MVSCLTGLKAGILEEMVFRGYVMKLLEKRWNSYIAILIPSFVFSLFHIPAIENKNMVSILLVVVSGTLVGTMFSLIAYESKSISNSILVHFLWNLIFITDILQISTPQQTYGHPIFSLSIPSEHIWITGGGFGIEASLIAVIGYAIVCLLVISNSTFSRFPTTN